MPLALEKGKDGMVGNGAIFRTSYNLPINEDNIFQSIGTPLKIFKYKYSSLHWSYF